MNVAAIVLLPIIIAAAMAMLLFVISRSTVPSEVNRRSNTPLDSEPQGSLTATRWTKNLLSDAADLVSANRPRDALKCLLTVLTVHPGEPEALRLVASLAYGRPRRDEPNGITADDLRDTRLDPAFCHCDAPGCSASWISTSQVVAGDSYVVSVANPIGGRCIVGHGYYCRNHFTADIGCPRCGGRLDAPRVPNGRPSLQTARQNATIVHAFVLWERTDQIGTEAMSELLNAMAPDVLEDCAKITGTAVRSLGNDVQGLSLAHVAKANSDYLAGAYDLYTHDGRDRDGKRWALVKIVTASPKYVDPDDPTPARQPK